MKALPSSVVSMLMVYAAFSFTATAKGQMDIFELAQELLDAQPDRAEAEQIIGLKMKEVFRATR